MEEHELKGIIEGLLFASGDEGVSINQLTQVLNQPEFHIQDLLKSLKYDYDHMNRGLTLIHSKNLFYLTTKPEHSQYVEKLLKTPQASRLSQAALETLAIIAYKQTITRIEIEDIRGVKSERAIQTLMNRGLIEEAGRQEGPGRPILLETTKDFLTHFGLTSLEELPSISENISTDETDDETNLFFTEHTDFDEKTEQN